MAQVATPHSDPRYDHVATLFRAQPAVPRAYAEPWRGWQFQGEL